MSHGGRGKVSRIIWMANCCEENNYKMFWSFLSSITFWIQLFSILEVNFDWRVVTFSMCYDILKLWIVLIKKASPALKNFNVFILLFIFFPARNMLKDCLKILLTKIVYFSPLRGKKVKLKKHLRDFLES